MSFANPTPLQVGATGTLNGWSVRVAGRVVMSVEVDGETYYWNEYNLVDRSGHGASLVFEEGEDGPEWKLFRAFTPLRSLTAAEAAAKRVGDRVDLDGASLPITLVDESRVCHIEGTAPEGMEVGDVAHYFNVDTGTRMLVASWTGDEIEFYEGLDAPAESVASAFQLAHALMPGTSGHREVGTRSSFNAGPSSGGGASWFTRLVLPVLGLASTFGVFSCFRGGLFQFSSGSKPPAVTAPATILANGAAGSLAAQRYVIDGQAVVEVARRNGRHARREYHLRGDTRDGAFLINGLSGGSREWHLFRPAPVPAGLTPIEAANRRKGAVVTMDGHALKVTDLFQAKALSADGQAGTSAGAIHYGFVATDGTDWMIARWNESQIEVLRGTPVADADVMTALGKK